MFISSGNWEVYLVDICINLQNVLTLWLCFSDVLFKLCGNWKAMHMNDIIYSPTRNKAVRACMYQYFIPTMNIVRATVVNGLLRLDYIKYYLVNNSIELISSHTWFKCTLIFFIKFSPNQLKLNYYIFEYSSNLDQIIGSSIKYDSKYDSSWFYHIVACIYIL